MATLLQPITSPPSQDPTEHSAITFQGPQAPTTTDPYAGILVVVYPDHSLAIATTKENEELVIGNGEGEVEENNTDEELSIQHPLFQTHPPSTMYMRLARYYSNPMRTRRRKFLLSFDITKYLLKQANCSLYFSFIFFVIIFSYILVFI
jgi:hypothetical protein